MSGGGFGDGIFDFTQGFDYGESPPYDIGDDFSFLDPGYGQPDLPPGIEEAFPFLSSDYGSDTGGIDFGLTPEGGSDWSKIAGTLAKAFGVGGGSGGVDIAKLLQMLMGVGLGGYGLMNRNSAGTDAAKLLKDAADKASAEATGLIGGSRANFAPYINAGTSALPQLQAMVGQNLADKFVSGGQQSNAAAKFHGLMSLADLAKR